MIIEYISIIFGSLWSAFFPGRFGVGGVFTLIAASMAVVVFAIGAFGPKVKDLPLEQISR